MQYKENLNLRENTDFSYVFQPIYCKNFHGCIEECCYSELVRNKEYSTELPTPSKNQMQRDNEDENGESQYGGAQFKSTMSMQSLATNKNPHL